MLNSFFVKLLEMSAKGSIVILAVLVVRLLLRRAPRKAVFILWAAVLLRLLCPLTLSSPVGLLSEKEMIPAATVTASPMPAGASPAPVNMTEYAPQHPAISAPSAGDTASAPVQTLPGSGEPKAEKSIAWKDVLPYLWLSGCILLLGYSIGSGLRLRYRLRESVETEKRVRMADGLESAFVLGLLRPCVYLPSELPEGARPYILAHERAHIRRGDTLWKRLGWLALCLHWFNPLVWLAFFLASRDMEMACDEQVLGRNAGDIRADYSELLLRLSTGKHFLAAPLAFGEGDTGSRIRHILKWKKPRTWLMVVAALICIAAVVFCVLERSGKETVWERELPEFRTTVRVQWDGKKYSVTHTRVKKRKDDAIYFADPSEMYDRTFVTATRQYYDRYINSMTHDHLQIYLLTAEDTTGMRDAVWETPGLTFDVSVLDGNTLVILSTQVYKFHPEWVDVLEIGRKLASGEYPEETASLEDNGPPEPVAEYPRELTAEEIQTVNDRFDWLTQEHTPLEESVHAFLTCYFDTPAELHLETFLSYLFYGGEELLAGADEEEFQLWQVRGGRGFAATEIAAMPVPVHRYPAEKVNEVLTEYMGITVDDLILPYWEMSGYLPETNAFYNTTSDFAMGTFRCEAGETDGETVHLFSKASRKNCAVLTLRKSGEKWTIAAHQLTNENGEAMSAVPAGEWRYQLSPENMEELFANLDTLPLDTLTRFLLKADGAYAEGGAAELYRRFMQKSVDVIEYLTTLGNITVAEHPYQTAAKTLCDMIVTEAAADGESEAFPAVVEVLCELYPESRQRALADDMWGTYQRLKNIAGNSAAEAGPVLYLDGWEEAITL